MAADTLPDSGLILVSGPSRGGKSSWAEHLAGTWPGEVLYLATGPAPGQDHAWSTRVQAHQQRRPDHWQCQEVGGELIEHLQRLSAQRLEADSPCLLIDSLGTWLAWHLEDEEPRWLQRSEALLQALIAHRGPVLLVVEETGWGVVPATAIGGLFRDRLGALQQLLMTHCKDAWLVVAGRALNLLQLGTPVPPA
jgi:adenosylcobinamide kinase/adenosylcobinamide-phosphate guanylyltransferase